jgi:uncharacterized protein (TIGR02001 family)
MQNYCKTIGALAAASALAAGNASAIEYNLHTGYTNEYLFRGVDSGSSLVEAGVDAATTWNGLGLSAGAWYGSFDAPTTGFASTELDLYGEVSKDFGFATLATGYIWYLNDKNAGSSDVQEAYFSASRDFGFAKASLTYFWDIEGDTDGYSELALSRSFELSPCLALKVASNVGYLVEQGDFTAWTTKVALDWGFVEHAKLSPFVAYSMALSDSVNTAYYHSKNELVAGSMLSVSF